MIIRLMQTKVSVCSGRSSGSDQDQQVGGQNKRVEAQRVFLKHVRSVPIKKSSDILSFSAVNLLWYSFLLSKVDVLDEADLRCFIHALVCVAEFLGFLLPTATGFCTEQSAFSLWPFSLKFFWRDTSWFSFSTFCCPVLFSVWTAASLSCSYWQEWHSVLFNCCSSFAARFKDTVLHTLDVTGAYLSSCYLLSACFP